jgi:hypothetical protein
MRSPLVVAALAIIGLAIVLYVMTRPPEPRAAEVSAPQVRKSETAQPISPVSADARQPTAADSSARASRDKLLDGIRDPRQGHEPWNDAGLALVDELGKEAVAVTDRGCYMAGCIGTFTFATDVAYRRAVDELAASAEYTAWTGGKQITPPETLANGQVIVALVLQRPD